MSLKTIGEFYRRNQVWLLYLYKPGMERAARFKDELIRVAERLHGIIKVASLNCAYEEELCDEFEVMTMPQLLIFTESDLVGDKYFGREEFEAVAVYATSKMQSFVQIVTVDNYEEF
jgi:thioredoxin-like negative regulator of GroEL